MEQDLRLEERIRAIGREIHSASRGTPPVFDTGRWLGRIMDRAMANESFKVNLFRYIDVLPSLKSDDLVTRLLREYFSGDAEVPKLIKRGAGLIAEKGLLPRAAARVVRKSVETMARQFIAGRNAEDASAALDALRADGASFSVDLLGEVVVSDKEAREYAERYLALLGFLGKRFAGKERPEVSIKATSLYSQLDPADWQGSIERTGEALRPLFRKARDLDIAVTFDMEHFHTKGLIIAIFKSILGEDEFKALPSAGIALQAYLRDAREDVAGLIRWARERKRKVAIRLVKGAYWDYEVAVNRRNGWPVPVFLDKDETDANFEELTRLLFENSDAVRPAIATHSMRSISHAAALSEAMKVPRDAFEFQMLYGMAEPLRKAVRGRGFNVRLYTPVGELIPGMAYLVRRLLENTSNESFLRRSFREEAPFEDLVRPPRPRRTVPAAAMPGSAYGFRNEPLLDFSIAENRARMADALSAIRGRMDRSYPVVTGVREVRTGRTIPSLNPARPREAVGRVSMASRTEADEAVMEALKARDAWRRTAPEKRAGLLFRAAGEMRKRRADLASLEIVEAGKTWKDADADVAEAVDYLEYYGREMQRLGMRRAPGDYPGEENEYRYEPKGVGVIISPWNFPLAIAAGMTSAALAAGNCAILKPSRLAPVTAYQLFDIFSSTGLPPGVLQYLPGPGDEIGEYLVSHPAIDFIAFTGSRDVGLRIIRLAAETGVGQRNVKKVVAEMGGKNAIIVDETADLDEAVKGIIESAFGYQGQKCSACSRLIVAGNVFDELMGRLTAAIESLRIGNPEAPGNFLGPVIDEGALKKIRSYIEIGKKEARLLLERKAPDEGYFVGPVVFVDAAPGSRIAQEEIFGPVLTVMRAKDIDGAIALANDSIYALTGGLFSRSPANIQKVKEEFRVGNLYINRAITGALVARQPFGGFGMSGVGSKAGGPDYLLQFMNPVSVSENTIRRGFAPLQ